ncbi:hypothetical protein BDY24DRAFT_267482 [Mrakia frigida]|uniref:uncharacterized protein n=1 Tax=Mrakia frigida TaxID=29902 RepID=UPI003FCC17E7
MILDELFGTLYSDRRRDLIEMLGSCCCSFERKRARGSQDEGEHECGIDCSSWNDCCSRAKFHSSPGWISSDEHDCHGNSEARRDLWNDYGGGTPVLEVSNLCVPSVTTVPSLLTFSTCLARRNRSNLPPQPYQSPFVRRRLLSRANPPSFGRWPSCRFALAASASQFRRPRPGRLRPAPSVLYGDRGRDRGRG